MAKVYLNRAEKCKALLIQESFPKDISMLIFGLLYDVEIYNYLFKCLHI